MLSVKAVLKVLGHIILAKFQSSIARILHRGDNRIKHCNKLGENAFKIATEITDMLIINVIISLL